MGYNVRKSCVTKNRRNPKKVYGTLTEWHSVRKKVLERDGHKCRICGATQNLQVDHIRLASRGGQTVMANLWTLCANCHAKRPGHHGARHLILHNKNGK